MKKQDEAPVRIRKPYQHTIPLSEKERRLKSIARWSLLSGVCLIIVL
ncbi:hypothetical protein ACFL3M_01140 [Patescibacteria group bacterium]